MPKLVWTPEEDAKIKEHYPAGGYRACLPILPDRTRKAIIQKASVLGACRITQSAGKKCPYCKKRPLLYRTCGHQDCLAKHKLQTDRDYYVKASLEKGRASHHSIRRKNKPTDYTPAEDAVLIEHYSTLGPSGCMGLLPNRNKESIMKHASKLGLRVVFESVICPYCKKSFIPNRCNDTVCCRKPECRSQHNKLMSVRRVENYVPKKLYATPYPCLKRARLKSADRITLTEEIVRSATKRNLNCEHIKECSMFAAMKNWSGFECEVMDGA